MNATGFTLTRVGFISCGNLGLGCLTFASGTIDRKDLVNFALSVVLTVSFAIAEFKAQPVGHMSQTGSGAARRSSLSASLSVYCTVLFAMLALKAFGAITHDLIAMLRASRTITLIADDASRLEAGINGAALIALVAPALGILAYLIGVQESRLAFWRTFRACAAAYGTVLLLNAIFSDPTELPLGERVRILMLQAPHGGTLSPPQIAVLITVAASLCGVICLATGGFIWFAAWLGSTSRRVLHRNDPPSAPGPAT